MGEPDYERARVGKWAVGSSQCDRVAFRVRRPFQTRPWPGPICNSRRISSGQSLARIEFTWRHRPNHVSLSR